MAADMQFLFFCFTERQEASVAVDVNGLVHGVDRDRGIFHGESEIGPLAIVMYQLHPSGVGPALAVRAGHAHWRPDRNLEGWAGVDTATMTVTGESAAPVPEPQSYQMLLVGLGLVGFAARNRTRRVERSSFRWSWLFGQPQSRAALHVEILAL
jgi:hypothetical protein